MDKHERKREAVIEICRRVFAEKTGLPAEPQTTVRSQRQTILEAAAELAADDVAAAEHK